jgi:hypothetical protein
LTVTADSNRSYGAADRRSPEFVGVQRGLYHGQPQHRGHGHEPGRDMRCPFVVRSDSKLNGTSSNNGILTVARR